MEGKQDFSWLTDIEKIQAEIAKDLEMTRSSYSLPASHDETVEATEHDESASEAVSITWADSTTGSEPWFVDTPSQATTANPSSYTNNGGFYRETIKVESHTQRSWAKTVAVILLVCVFGMGSLGFGLGAAYTWVTARHAAGISPEELAGNQDTPIITSYRYIFGIEGQQVGTVADMVALLEPAVVGITTRFAGDRIPPIAGSGTIFAENEERIFIVTGNYVVSNRVVGVPAHGREVVEAQPTVRISGSAPIPARMVSRDIHSGLAVISVDKAHLVAAGIDSVVVASFGDSSSMQVGDVVFAIGNARNEGNSVTRGIISAGKQELNFSHYTLTVLQTDAAINYGNSGGPLINLNGEVIGINIDWAGMLFDAASIEGIGYSIASNVAVPIIMEMINPTRPGLNIYGQTLDEETAADLGIPPMGVLVVNTMPGGAAEEAGIRQGDIITAFDGEPVFTMEELQGAIRARQIGDIVEVRILRDGELITVDAQLRALIR